MWRILHRKYLLRQLFIDDFSFEWIKKEKKTFELFIILGIIEAEHELRKLLFKQKVEITN